MSSQSTPVKRRKRKPLRKAIRSWTQGPFAMAALSKLAIWYLKFVVKTNKIIFAPVDALDIVRPLQPVIASVWHGQHILVPAVPIGLHASAMVSRNLDGEITARVIEHFGNKTVRASGGRDQKTTLKKGGITGFLDMLQAVRDGQNVIQTADIPKGKPRQVGMGIVMLAKKSGAPIIPMAFASSRRYVFQRSWDKTTLNLPFGKTVVCMGTPMTVPSDADDEAMESARDLLQQEMQRITTHAYELTGNPE